MFSEVLHISLALMFIYCSYASRSQSYILFPFLIVKCVKFTHWSLGYLSEIDLMNSFTSVSYAHSYNIIFEWVLCIYVCIESCSLSLSLKQPCIKWCYNINAVPKDVFSSVIEVKANECMQSVLWCAYINIILQLFTLPRVRNYFSLFSTEFLLHEKVLQNFLDLNYTGILCFI
jgi:hypothetical protein